MIDLRAPAGAAIILAALVLCLPQALAQDLQWQVGPWTIVETEKSCALGKTVDQNGGTTAALVIEPGRGGYLALQNARWVIEDQAKYEVTYLVDNDSWRGMAVGMRSKGATDGSITVNVDGAFIERFAGGKVFAAFKGGNPIAGFDLADSRAAVLKLQQCAGIVARRLELATKHAAFESEAKAARERVEAMIVDDPFGQPDEPPPVGHVPQAPQPAGVSSNWITSDDYPTEALNFGMQGETTFRLEIDTRGRVANCTITKSSGSALLDQTACSVLRRRASFVPPRDATGRPTTSSWASSFHWRLP